MTATDSSFSLEDGDEWIVAAQNSASVRRRELTAIPSVGVASGSQSTFNSGTTSSRVGGQHHASMCSCEVGRCCRVCSVGDECPLTSTRVFC